ncbi:biotin--[acetyl-CoA-carboxylase] ligase [Candidatus Vallotiella sp. (ex Adelges kitamiensis)]|uniref:biotin--[acetyl-CoA-carboxylase] ligase n=1 Tax=Candidatus Vallotiella sp. (ex Adelges kitamiensis) TaxID=2864217 RepID=UPI001CE2B065|nr:biotin--[acetyl-CoA-carboxylase] ligase [Candidatus Vallotia sp. (ex Adelges kitamiensis)]
MSNHPSPKKLSSLLGESGAGYGLPLAIAGGIEYKQLLELLDPQPSSWALEVVYETGSTNADLAARLKAARRIPFDPHVRVAYSQTAGRGRRSRPWLATPGNALLFSISHLMPRTPDQLSGLSLALGATIVDGLRTLPLNDVRRLLIKWPNDILLDGAKLAGVLVETVWNTCDATALVVGVGLNITSTDSLAQQIALSHKAFSTTSPLMPSALSSAWPHATLTPVLGAVLNALAIGLERFGQYGFEPFLDTWIAVHAYIGQEVLVLGQGGEVAQGIAYGIDEKGRLLIRTPQEIRAITTGDVSLRLSQNITTLSHPASDLFSYKAHINRLSTANASIVEQHAPRLPICGASAPHPSVTVLPSPRALPVTRCAHEKDV